MNQKLEVLAVGWLNDNGDPPDTEYQRGYMDAAKEHSRELKEALVDLVVIPRNKYDRLQHIKDELFALQAAGVNNWEGYDEAMSYLHEGE